MIEGAATDSVFDSALLDAVDAAVIASDVTGRVVRWNAAAERLYGFRSDQMCEANVLDLLVHPDDRDRAAGVLRQVLDGTPWSGEFSVRTADGGTRLVRLTDTPVVVEGSVVGIVGVGYDISDARFEQTQAADREQRLEQALVAAEVGTWRWDMSTGVTTWDEQLERIFGLPPGGFDGSFDMYASLLHPDDRDEVLTTVQSAVAARSAYELRHRTVWPDGQIRWIECRGQVTVQQGAVSGTIGCSWDATDRVVAEQAREAALEAAQRSTGRLRRLQQITADLAAAGDVDAVVDTIRDHVREAFDALSGGVALADVRRRTVTLHAAYDDPALPHRVLGPVDVAVDVPMTHVARTGEPLYLPSAQAMVDRFPAVQPMLAQSSSQSVACEPFPVAGSDLHGVLVASCAHPREWSAEDRTLLSAIARQCGTALERARLHGNSRRIAERLQAGLLPLRPVAVRGLETGAVYRPGGEATEHLGGDFYDVLPQPDGRVALVIGDVMGRGIDAAATMARISTAVRAFASVDPDPRAVLRNVDRFARLEIPEEFVTLLYALLDPGRGTVSVVCAGHLPLVVVRSDGCDALHLAGCPPVGLNDGDDRDVQDVSLAIGDALLLTTDGLIERPGVDLDEALTALAEQARELLLAGRSVEEVAGALVTRADVHDRADDMTLVLARLVAPG